MLILMNGTPAIPIVLQIYCRVFVHYIYIRITLLPKTIKGLFKNSYYSQRRKNKTGLLIVTKAKVCDTYWWNAANIWCPN